MSFNGDDDDFENDAASELSEEGDGAGSEGDDDAQARRSHLEITIYPQLLVDTRRFLEDHTLTLGSSSSFPLSLVPSSSTQVFEIFRDGGMSYKLHAINGRAQPGALAFQGAYVCPALLDDYNTPAPADFPIPQNKILVLPRVPGQAPHKLLVVGQLTDGTVVWNRRNDGGIVIAHIRPNPRGLPRQTAPQLEIDLTQHGCFGTQRIRNTFGPSRWNVPGRSCFIIGVWDPAPDRWRLFAQIIDMRTKQLLSMLELVIN